MLRSVFIAFIFCVFLEACNTFYNTASPYVPVFKESHALQTEVSLGSSGVNVAGSYTPVSRFYFGGSLHALSGNNNTNISGGPHIGYYQNGDSLENFHLNAQLGYNFGSVSYGDRSDTSFVSGLADYNGPNGQLFIGADLGKTKPYFLGVGISFAAVQFDYRLMHYPYRVDGPFADKAIVGCIFVVYRRLMLGTKNLYGSINAGYQKPLPDVRGSQYLVMPVLLRFGISYQFHMNNNRP